MPSPIRRRPLIAVAAVAIALAGCTASPLYAPAALTGTSIPAELRAIAIPDTSDRVGQEVRNQLILAFTGGGEPAPTRYELVLGVTSRQSGTVSPRSQTLRLMQVSASFRLTEIGTGTVIFAGNTEATGTFAGSNQGFADLRAQRDAEDRAAREIAEEIRLRIATALAAGPV